MVSMRMTNLAMNRKRQIKPRPPTLSDRGWLGHICSMNTRPRVGRAMSNSLYERDFYAWANEQAALLRAGRLTEADIENIAEEIESMGRSEKRELINRLTVLLTHLLKWQFQATFRGNSWRLTIEEQRHRVEDHFADNPSLKSQLDQAIRSAYRSAASEASLETGLARSAFPTDCPHSFEQMMNPDFWPE
jgi:hypothetical protein